MVARKKPESNKHTAQLYVRIKPELKQAVDEMADKTGESISSMVETDLAIRVNSWRKEQ